MSMIEIFFGIAGLTFFILPAFYLYGADREGIKDPAAEEMEQRREREREE